MNKQWNEIEICGRYFVYIVEDGELFVEDLHGNAVDQIAYDSVYENIPKEIYIKTH